MEVWFKRFSTRGLVPQKSTIGSACYDPFAAKCSVLEPGATRSGETHIEFFFSEKYVTKMYPCSSMSVKSIFLGGRILDSDYRRNVRLSLHNLSNNRLELMPGIV